MKKNCIYSFFFILLCSILFFNSPIYGAEGSNPAMTLECTSFRTTTGEAQIECSTDSFAVQYEFQIYNRKDKLIHSELSQTPSITVTLKTNAFYRVIARPIYQNNDIQSPGQWSANYYICAEPQILSMKQAGKKIKVKYSKILNAKNYTLYIADQKDGPYKKIKTTSKQSFTISKCKGKKLKKGNTYYVYVVANYKPENIAFHSTTQYYYFQKLR